MTDDPEPHVEPYIAEVKVLLHVLCPLLLWAVVRLAL